MRTLVPKQALFILLVLVLLLCAGGGAIAYLLYANTGPEVEDVDAKIASLQGDDYRSYFNLHVNDFYEREGINGMVQRVIKALENKQISMFICHSLAHDLGHYAGYPDNFASIQDYLTKENLDFCGSGFMHGVEGQLANEPYPQNVESLYEFCQMAMPLAPYYYGCYHGAGHAFMENNQEPVAALRECDILKTDNGFVTDVTNCYRGVFSENADYMGLQDGMTAADLLSFCSSLDEKYQTYCAMELNGLHVGHTAEGQVDADTAFKNCMEGDYSDIIKEGCIQSLSWVVTDHMLSTEGMVFAPSPYIQTLPEDLRRMYLKGTHGSFVKTAAYRSDVSFTDFCNQLTDTADREYCLNLPIEYAQIRS